MICFIESLTTLKQTTDFTDNPTFSYSNNTPVGMKP